MRFVIEVLKQSGCPKALHLLGFDAWFKELDRGKKGALEMGSMTGLALKVANFGKVRLQPNQRPQTTNT